MNLKEKLYRKRKIYTGTAVDFYSDLVYTAKGTQSTREYLFHKGAVAVLPFLTDKTVVLVQQYRYPLGKTIYEIPAGKLEPSETALTCAKRELEEETGYRARKWKKIYAFYPSPAFSTEILHIYLATDLIRTSAHCDPDEIVNVKLISYPTALKWIKQGKISDAKSVIAFWYCALHIKPQFRRNQETGDS